MKRVKIIVDGEVQGVGYRALVKCIALSLGIKGVVRNLEDGRVEVECEVKNKETLEKFMNLINIKREKDELFVPNVKNIQLVSEEEVEKCSFKEFRIDYGEDIRIAEKEMIERSEIAILAFENMGKRLGGKIDKVGEEVKCVREEVRKVGENLSGLRSETQANFDRMDEKYGKISENMEKLSNRLAESSERIAKALEKIIELFAKGKKD